MARKIAVTPPGWESYQTLTFAPAVRKGNMLFISGVSASHYDSATGQSVVKGDIVEQTRVIYEKMKQILQAAGASFDDVVWTTDYITTKEKYKATGEIRRQYFGKSFPASTGVIVKSLLNPDALIEIDAVAVLDK